MIVPMVIATKLCIAYHGKHHHAWYELPEYKPLWEAPLVSAVRL